MRLLIFFCIIPLNNLSKKSECAIEALQQHNCVASYFDFCSINFDDIWVARSCKEPNKSLATLQPYKSLKGYIQKYYHFNEPIEDKPMLEFLDRALKHARDVRDGKVDPILLEIRDGVLVEIK